MTVEITLVDVVTMLLYDDFETNFVSCKKAREYGKEMSEYLTANKIDNELFPSPRFENNSNSPEMVYPGIFEQKRLDDGTLGYSFCKGVTKQSILDIFSAYIDDDVLAAYSWIYTKHYLKEKEVNENEQR